MFSKIDSRFIVKLNEIKQVSADCNTEKSEFKLEMSSNTKLMLVAVGLIALGNSVRIDADSNALMAAETAQY